MVLSSANRRRRKNRSAIRYQEVGRKTEECHFDAFFETKPTALASLQKGSYAHASGVRASNLDDTVIAGLTRNAGFCSNLLFCNR